MRWIQGVAMVCCLTVLAGCAGMDLAGMGRRENAVTGKPVNMMESQLLEVQACMGRIDGVVVESAKDCITITLRCDSVFDKNTARINSPGACGLDDLAAMLGKHAETKVKVEAHTDCTRSEEENLVLSETRAAAVKETLVTKGVDGSRITARGWGEAKPAASNATEEGRGANRRVTITLLPNQG